MLGQFSGSCLSGVELVITVDGTVCLELDQKVDGISDNI